MVNQSKPSSPIGRVNRYTRCGLALIKLPLQVLYSLVTYPYRVVRMFQLLGQLEVLRREGEVLRRQGVDLRLQLAEAGRIEKVQEKTLNEIAHDLARPVRSFNSNPV